MSFTNWLRSLRSVIAPGRVERQHRSRILRHGPAARYRPQLEVLEDRLTLSTFSVTTALDEFDGGTAANPAGPDGLLSLREAIGAASSGDHVRFDHRLSGSTILLDPGKGELLIDKDLRIKGLGAEKLAISGNHASRIFEVASGAQVTLSNLTITGGNGQTGNAADPHEGRGGGVVVDEGAALTITDSTVTDNTAPLLGGGIANYGTLTVSDCAVSDNHALGTYGGGIAVFSGAPFSAPFSATLTVCNSVVAGNTALQNGGGITGVASTVTLNNCSVTGNSSQLYDGGGLNNHGGGTFTVLRSVVANNTANGFGGGIQNDIDSTLTVRDSAVYGNSARYGGGIDNSGTLTLRDSQLSQNTTQMYGLGGGIFNKSSGTIVMMRDLLIENAAEVGGGIFSVGNVTMRDSTLTRNSARNSGGAIENYGTLSVNHTVLSHNSSYYGGAIQNGGTATIFGSEISYNSATDSGGGIINFGMLTIGASQIRQNTAVTGGGIDNEYGALTLSDSLLSGNSASEKGGGIMNWDTMTIDHCTLSGNSAGNNGGGICNLGTLTFKNSSRIIRNTAPVGFGADVDNAGVLYVASNSKIGILDGIPAVLT